MSEINVAYGSKIRSEIPSKHSSAIINAAINNSPPISWTVEVQGHLWFLHEVTDRSWHDPHSLSGCLVDNGCIVFGFISKSTCSIFEKPFMLVITMHGSVPVSVWDDRVTGNQTWVNAVRHTAPLDFHYFTPNNLYRKTKHDYMDYILWSQLFWHKGNSAHSDIVQRMFTMNQLPQNTYY